MLATSKIRRQGDAAVITIPPALLRLLHLEPGAQMELDVANGELIARPVNSTRRRYSLAELLKGSEAIEQLNADTAWAREGKPIGRELG